MSMPLIPMPPRETRRLFASVLGMEAVVFWLAIIVAIVRSHVDATLAVSVGVTLAVAAVVLAGMLRYRWAYVGGSVLQALAILSGFVVPSMFILGILFAGLWIAAFRMGKYVHPPTTP
jgi:hypothetical protein